MATRPPQHRAPGYRSPARRIAEYDRLRDKQEWRRWYKTGQWQRIAKRQIASEPTCRLCRAKGLATPATVCDHVERHNGDPVRFWSGPFQSLCASCHSSDKQRQEREAIS